MSIAYQMPVRTELASRVGPQLWRKTILRAGHIIKGGVDLDVDRKYLETLVNNFTSGAKDQVQFVLGHDENPELFRGELRGLEITDDDDLVGLFETTGAGSKLIEENPRLGASVSLVDRFERADGRKYGPTLLHVAATLDPEVSGLGNWVRAELSASKTEVIDLSTSDEGVAPAPNEAPTQKGEETDHAKPGDDVEVPVASLTEEQIAKLLSLIEGDGSDSVAEDKTEPTDKSKTEKPSDDDEEFTEAELDAMAAPAPEEPQKVAASADHTEALELANARIDAQAMELSAMRRERDEERFKGEKEDLSRNFGIPVDVVELAKPLLLGTGHTLELSAGKTTDAGQVMRKVLHELGRRYAKALDLGSEYGTADAEDDMSRRAKENESFFTQANAEFGRKGV